MPENQMNEYLKASLEGIRGIAGVDTVIGNAINTPSGVTVIPVSKVTMGFASGGVDLGSKIGSKERNGGGGGTGISITPVAFLTINSRSDIQLIPITEGVSSVDRFVSLFERAPEIIDGIKGSLK